jgi:hypothetical protein
MREVSLVMAARIAPGLRFAHADMRVPDAREGSKIIHECEESAL